MRTVIHITINYIYYRRFPPKIHTHTIVQHSALQHFTSAIVIQIILAASSYVTLNINYAFKHSISSKTFMKQIKQIHLRSMYISKITNYKRVVGLLKRFNARASPSLEMEVKRAK